MHAIMSSVSPEATRHQHDAAPAAVLGNRKYGINVNRWSHDPLKPSFSFIEFIKPQRRNPPEVTYPDTSVSSSTWLFLT